MNVSGRAAVIGTLVLVGLLSGGGAVAEVRTPAGVQSERPAAVGNRARWPWPVTPTRVLAAFQAPASEYGAGHRGVDLQASPGQTVQSPTAAVVKFRGEVAGRPVLSLTTAEGLSITLEPVLSELHAGDAVAAGEVLGRVGLGGHCSERCIHLGVIANGSYLNPMRFFDTAQRARLLPLFDG